MTVKRFLIFISLISLIIGTTAYFVELYTYNYEILVPKFWLLFSFLLGITILAYIVSMNGISKGGENSIFIIMGVATLKLLLCMGLVLAYLLKFEVNSIVFVIEFFSLYFSFTSFEVYALLCNLRHQNKT